MLKTKITPLYERLSRDDELQGESNSISQGRHQLQNVLFVMDIGEGVVVHRLLEVDGVENPFDIAELREITRYDELELDTLGDRKTALFLIMSDGRCGCPCCR